MLRAVVAWLLAIMCASASGATVHDSIDSAYLHAGLNPVHSKPNSKTGAVRAVRKATDCKEFKLEDILLGCFGLPNEIHPHTDPVLQVGTLNISSEGTDVFPVRGTELVVIPLQGSIQLENGLKQRSSAAQGEVVWLSSGSGSTIALKSTSGGSSSALLVVFDTPLSRKAELPHFQHFAKAALKPFQVPTKRGTGNMVLYSGAMHDHHGPVHSYTVALLGIARFAEGAIGELHIPAPKTGMLFVLQGKARFGGTEPGTGGRLGRFGAAGQVLRLTHPTRFGGVQHDKEHAQHRFAKQGTGFTDDVWVHNIAGSGELVVAVVSGLPAQHGDEVNVRGAVALPASQDLDLFFSDARTGHWQESKGHFHTPTSHGHSEADGPTLQELEQMAGMEHSHPQEAAPPRDEGEEEEHDEL